MDIHKGLDSNQLMNFVKKSSQQAYEMLYERLWEKCFVLSYVILGDRSQAKDVVQDIWMSLWERRYFIDDENIEAYLMRATKLRAYKEIRNTSYRKKLVKEFLKNYNLELSQNNVDNNFNLQETHNVISLLLQALPKRCKEVFELSRNQGLSNSEIAERLEISKRTVETHITNALKFIRSKQQRF